MGVDVNQLPPHLRDRVYAELGKKAPQHARQRERITRAESTGPQRCRCSCGELFGSFPAAERHSRATRGGGHSRIELMFEEQP